MGSEMCIRDSDDAVSPPLSRPYIGPFPVLSRTDKVFRLLRNGKDWPVSVDRLKPAFMESMPTLRPPLRSPAPRSLSLDASATSTTPTPPGQDMGSVDLPSSPSSPLPDPMPELVPALDPVLPPRPNPPSPIRPTARDVGPLTPGVGRHQPDAHPGLVLSDDDEFPPLPAPTPAQTTRSGRVSRPPERYQA